MACGTPVLALNRGAVPEIVVDGVTGFVRTQPEELIDTIAALDRIDPAACRARVEEYFNPELMVDRYERLYQQVVSR
jgi:glycosyltransferase involved in cell wall biosynthesis